ncbi:protein argonaute-4-like [Uloborus diversus]|uniref:protein argonaute-4-like n=1 Tax=Uloborus diversus TaxID=327109 RepID=UPI00240A5006|nr:protein argonaute-4-like [Uloborus diversus]
MANLLDAFSRNNHGKQPEKIIVYRSSLSKSQFKNALETEVKYIREACKDINENYKPGVAFISVQKSNHIRFKPENEKDGVGKMKNIPPGAIIEDTVTDSLYQDFLLCSHLAEQGTSRATRYTVLENDTSMTAHEIQKLTYDLCHCYAPGTSSISVPAPVRYARLAGRRVWTKLLCYEENSCDDEFQLISSETALKFTKVDDALKNTMYFV